MDGLWRERECRDLMVHEWPENQGSLWESLYRPFLEREYFACSTSLHQVWYKLQIRCNEKGNFSFQHSFNNATWSANDTNSGQVCSQNLFLLLKVRCLRTLRAISLDLNECQHITFHTYESKSTKIECIYCNNLFSLKTLKQSIIGI